MTQWIDFPELRKRITIELVLDHYGVLEKLRRTGDSLIGVCPLPTHVHTHTKPNTTQFNVWLTKNGWHCFGCQDHGNIYDFVAMMEGMDRRAPGYPREPALTIMAWFGISFERPQGGRRTGQGAVVPATATVMATGQEAGPVSTQPVLPIPELKPASTPEAVGNTAVEETMAPTTSSTPDAGQVKVNAPLKFALKHLDAAHPYLTERGFTPEASAHFGLGYCQKGIMAGRIAIPIHNEHGELVAYGGRWPGNPPDGEGKYKFPAGFHKSLVVFNLHRAKDAARADGLILVEGFFDALRLWQAGYPQVVALMGSSLSKEQEVLITDAVGPGGRVTLLFDEDDAGRTCRQEVLDRLMHRLYVRVVALDTEGMQPDTMHEDDLRARLG